jgi:hypothetical protein
MEIMCKRMYWNGELRFSWRSYGMWYHIRCTLGHSWHLFSGSYPFRLKDRRWMKQQLSPECWYLSTILHTNSITLIKPLLQSYPITVLDRPLGLQEVEASRISRQSAHEGGKFVSPTQRPHLPPGDIPGTHFCWRPSRRQSHIAAGRITPMKNLNDPIGNQTRDLPACIAVASTVE